MGRNEIPEDLVSTVEEWREKLVESVAEQDDTLMEKYFEDPDSLTEEEIHVRSVKRLSLWISLHLCVVQHLRTRSVQTMLDAVMRYLPSPYDVGSIIGTDPDDEEEESVSQIQTEPFAGLHLRLQLTHS